MIDTLLRLGATRGFWLAVAGVALVWLIYLAGYQWRPATQVRVHQAALMKAVRKGDSDKWAALISATYADQWGLSKADSVAAFKELRPHFLAIDLQPEEGTEPSVAIEDESGRFTVKLHGLGSGTSPVGPAILTFINELEEPFVFEWRKSGGAPWNWELVNVSNEGVSSLGGYEPGGLDGMIQGF